MKAQGSIVITGSNGQLGSELKDLAASFPQFQFIALSRAELPVQDPNALYNIIDKYHPAFLVNCAAYTAVDKAEAEKEIAFDVNGTAVGNMARICNEKGIKFLHISTDYVYDGSAQKPLRESDPVRPVNAYGESKRRGEELALANNPQSIIIRTSWVYSTHGHNFVKTMLRLMREKESISVVNDQIGSPTYAADLAAVIMRIITSGTWVPGIYNYSNEGVISWFDFATEIRHLSGAHCAVHPIPTEQFPTPARRPKYSVLDKARIRDTYAIELKDWRSSLKTCLQRLQP